MTTIAVMTIPAENMVLADTLQTLSNCRIRVEETAFTDADDFVHVWITADDLDEIDEVLAADPSIDGYDLVTENERERLYRMEISSRMLLPREAIHELDGQIVEAYADGEEWTLEVRFNERDDLSDTVDLLDRFDIRATYESITDIDREMGTLPGSLTSRQREVVQTAIDEGYYDVPREVTLEELAENLDVSHQALSECLRRAQKQLAEEQVSTEFDESSAEAMD